MSSVDSSPLEKESPCCNFLKGCTMFARFHRYARDAYIDMYCQGDYETCQRRRLRLAGKAVPENLLPFGGTLWDAESNSSN